jgi:hypothetical protein
MAKRKTTWGCTMTLTDAERDRLSSFRNAAREVREASIIARGQVITIEARPNERGEIDAVIDLLGHEPFRSLALAIRLVYQSSEPAHYLAVCNILSREGTPDIQARVAALRDQYHAALRNPAGAIVIDAGGARKIFTPQQVFEHWLYGIAFHQDLERQASVQLLASVGAAFPFSVQSTGLLIAGRILDLDDVVAGFLGESQLQRI